VKNDCLDAALRELRAAGIRGIERSYGGKHIQLRWQRDGHPLRLYTLPATPSDWRSPHNVRADIRRILREDGLLVPAEPSTPTRIPSRLERLEQRVAHLERKLKEA
jgi:hypothetical protein